MGAVAVAAVLGGAVTAGASGSHPAPCGSATAATIGAVDASVVAHVYANELGGTEVRADLQRVMSAADLSAGVAQGNQHAVLAATTRIVYHRYWHIVRLRVTDLHGRLLADVGGPYVTAPVNGTISSGGRAVGRFVMSVQDDYGVVKLEWRFVGDPAAIYVGSKPVTVYGTVTFPTGVPHGNVGHARRHHLPRADADARRVPDRHGQPRPARGATTCGRLRGALRDRPRERVRPRRALARPARLRPARQLRGLRIRAAHILGRARLRAHRRAAARLQRRGGPRTRSPPPGASPTRAVPGSSSSTSDQVTLRDRAYAVADAGLQAAIFRLNETGGTTGETGTLGNGAAYAYTVNALGSQSSSCAGLWVQNSSRALQQECVTATGTAGGYSVQVQDRVVGYTPIPSIFPVNGIFAVNGFTAGQNLTDSGVIASNGQISWGGGSISVSGTVEHLSQYPISGTCSGTSRWRVRSPSRPAPRRRRARMPRRGRATATPRSTGVRSRRSGPRRRMSSRTPTAATTP